MRKKKLYTVDEIAEMYGVTGTAVRNWIAEGLVCQKQKLIGKRTRIVIKPEDVIAFHKSKEIE